MRLVPDIFQKFYGKSLDNVDPDKLDSFSAVVPGLMVWAQNAGIPSQGSRYSERFCKNQRAISPNPTRLMKAEWMLPDNAANGLPMPGRLLTSCATLPSAY